MIKQKIIVCMICLIVTSLSLSSVIPAKPEEDLGTEESLHVGLFGSSLLVGLRRVGCVITNPGEDALHNVHWMFTIKDVDMDIFIFAYDDYVETLDPQISFIFSIDQLNDIGFVEITATANCFQTGEVTESKIMLQLGPFFIGPPFLFAYM
jgi:hypothetical protein